MSFHWFFTNKVIEQKTLHEAWLLRGSDFAAIAVNKWHKLEWYFIFEVEIKCAFLKQSDTYENVSHESKIQSIIHYSTKI